jgi:hypothetical protein
MKNVSAKLLKVIGSVSGNVKKSGHNSHQHYDYVMEKDLLDVVRDELVKQGLLVLMSVDSHSRTGDITTVKTKHTIIDTDSGEYLEVFSIGEGQDRGDKAAPKSLTSSSKYFWLKTFLLSGGDDPENDEVVTNGTTPVVSKTTVTAAKSNFGSFKKPEPEPEAPATKKSTWPKTTTKSEKVEY